MLAERDVVARVRRVQLKELRLWVREGWIKPSASENGPVFDELDMAKAPDHFHKFRVILGILGGNDFQHDASP